MDFFFPGCVFVLDAEATGCGTNPVIPSIPRWHRPGSLWTVEKCSGWIGKAVHGHRNRPESAGGGPSGVRSVRDEPHPDLRHTEEAGGVDVDPMESHREMERPGRHGDGRAAANAHPAPNQRGSHEAVGGPQAAGVIDADESRAPHPTDERDCAVGGSDDHVTFCGVVLDPAVAGAVGPVGQSERIQNRRRRRRRHDQLGGHRQIGRHHDDTEPEHHQCGWDPRA